ncbi:hypothetical protein FHG87_004923 [Trinorchestia longiramus]|nr:hypothetical protein FHG87_004923 [Trinorchestia longiramus]
MSSAKRKPRTPSPLEDVNADKVSYDAFAGRRVSVSEFDTHELVDYDDVASPGASSTSSEPSYVRQPGFDQHAHEVTVASTSGVVQKSRKSSHSKKCKKKKSCPEESGEIITIAPIPQVPSTRPKIKKEPLPMKLRALPQSFWVQPNRASCIPPSGALLPPLLLGKDLQDVTEVWPVTPPEDQDLRMYRDAGNKYSISTPSPTLSSHSLLNLHHSPSSSSLSNTTIASSHSSSSLAALASSTTSSSSQPMAAVLRGTAYSPPCESHTGFSSLHPSSPASPTLVPSAPHSPSSSSFSSHIVPSSCPSVCQSPCSSSQSSSVVKCTPEGGLCASYQERRGERIIKVGNTDLLFSLFDKVEQGDRRKFQLLKRSKIRKGTTPPSSRPHKEEDPCLVGAVTEGILPHLDSTHSSGASTPLGMRPQVVEMVSMKEGDRTLSLPSLNTDPNYNHILSELVMRL